MRSAKNIISSLELTKFCFSPVRDSNAHWWASAIFFKRSLSYFGSSLNASIWEKDICEWVSFAFSSFAWLMTMDSIEDLNQKLTRQFSLLQLPDWIWLNWPDDREFLIAIRFRPSNLKQIRLKKIWQREFWEETFRAFIPDEYNATNKITGDHDIACKWLKTLF